MPVKADVAKTEEKPPTPVLVDASAFDKTGLLRSDDLELVQRAKKLFSQDKPDGGDRYSLSRDLSTAMGEAVRQIRATEPQASAREAERTIQTQQNAAARNAGQQEPWKAGEGNCTWHVLAAQRQRELDTHTEGKRPSGLFSGAAGKEYDAKTASLTSQIDNIRRAAAKVEAELRAKLAEQAQQAAQNAPQHAAAQERHAGLMLLHKAVNDASRQIEAAEEKTNDRGHSDDFER